MNFNFPLLVAVCDILKEKYPNLKGVRAMPNEFNERTEYWFEFEVGFVKTTTAISASWELSPGEAYIVADEVINRDVAFRNKRTLIT